MLRKTTALYWAMPNYRNHWKKAGHLDEMNAVEAAIAAGRTDESPIYLDGLRVTTAFGNDNRLTYTYGSAAAHVAVDPGTGDVELLDCLVVEDVGRIVNPLTLHGQAIGGMVQGMGGASWSISSMMQMGSCWPATLPTT